MQDNRLLNKLCNLFAIGMYVLSVATVTTAATVEVESKPVLRLEQIDGSTIECRELSIDRGGDVRMADSDKTLSLSDLTSIVNLSTAKSQGSPPSQARVRLLLPNSGVLAAARLTLDTGEFDLQSETGLSSIPAEIVRAIIWQDSDTAQETLANPSSEQDSVIVQGKNGARGVQGVLERIDDQHVWLNFRGQSRKIGLEKVQAIVMADLGLPPATGTMAKVKLADTSQLEGVLRTWNEGQIQLEVAAGSIVSFPATFLVNLSIDSDRQVYLSDLQPITAQQRAIFSVDRMWQRDRNVTGGTLTLVDRNTGTASAYSKGLGTSSWSRLVFENDRGFDRFACVAGIDTSTSGRGNCRMLVRGDGIEVWSAHVSGQTAAVPVDIDISGMRTIELEVQPGKDFDLADHANWCNARFLISK